MKLNKIFSSKKSFIITIIFCTGIIIVFWILSHKLTQQKILRLNLERQKLAQINTNILNYKNKYGDLDEYLAKLEERYNLANISLPEQMQQGEFINFLQQTALEQQVKIISLNTGSIQLIEESDKNDVENNVESNFIQNKESALSKLPISIKIECDYVSLIKFLKTVEESERLMKIDNLTIIGKDDGDNIICNLNIVIFALERRKN